MINSRAIHRFPPIILKESSHAERSHKGKEDIIKVEWHLSEMALASHTVAVEVVRFEPCCTLALKSW